MPEWLDPDESLRVVGDVHLHPTGRREPSRVDLESWVNRLETNERACMFTFASIIVTPGRASGPELRGWVTRRVKPGRYVCEPAAIVDPLGYCQS